MKRSERQYSRIYYDDLIRDYKYVVDDDAAFAAFVRLLAVADKMWPAIPELPRSVGRRALATLNQPNEKGNRLVEILPGHGYRIRGHDAERAKRAGAARNAAEVRWENERNAAGNAPGNADAHASAMPRRDETRRDEIPLPRRAGRRKDGTNPRAIGTNPRAQGTSTRQSRAAEKRLGMPLNVAQILRDAAKSA